MLELRHVSKSFSGVPAVDDVSFSARAGEVTGYLDRWHQVNAPMLFASVLMTGAAVLGARVVFSMPLDLRANWIFRVTPIREATDCMKASRRALFVLAILPVWTVSAIAFLSMWPWRPAAGHLAVLLLLGTMIAEVCLHNFHKIPFTCSYLPGRSYAHMAFMTFLGLLFLMDKGADLERRALQNPEGLAMLLGLFCILAVLARWRTETAAHSPEGTLQFEEASVPAVLSLGLNRDGVSPV